ncbi:hypothetical protein [Cetobacterium somerae]
MWYKTLEIDFKDIVRKQIEVYDINENVYKIYEENIFFKFDSIEFQLSEGLVINGVEIRKFNEENIKRVKNIFQNTLLINDIRIKEKNKKVEEFIEVILNEWLDLKRDIKVFTLEHPILEYKNDIKIKYIKTLNNLLWEASPYIIKKQKYLYLIGKALQIEPRILKDLILEDLKSIEIKDEIPILIDFLGYFKCFNISLPKSQILKEILGKVLKNEKLIMILEKNCREEQKMEKSLNKVLNNQDKKIKEIVTDATIYSNCNKNILTKRMDKKMQEVKISFIRNGNEHFFLKTYVENKKLEYLKNIDSEDDVFLQYEGTEPINFKNLIQSFEDKVLEEELSQKYPAYRKNWKNITFKERENISIPLNIGLSDITEKLILGHLELNKDYLQSNGIWAFQGERWLKVTFENLLTELKNISNVELDYSLTLNYVGNEEIKRDFIIKDKIKTNMETKDADTHDLEVIFPIDSTILGEYLKKDYESTSLNFILEVTIELNDIDQKFVLGIPIFIKLNDPTNKKYSDGNSAAIDFGTSSTCIAIRMGGKKKLLSIEKFEDHKIQAYENPTNLLIKDWDEFNKAWQEREEKFPIIQRFEKIDEEEGIYNQGHKVVANTMDPTKNELDAIIDQLKLVPYRNLTLGDKIIAKPYKTTEGGIKEIELISDYENQNQENFDPISFYGYLLGRVVMSPMNGNIVKNFSLTVPVKFEKLVKEKMLNSLEKGIKLASPLSIRNDLKIVEGKEEPVAFIGAIYANKTARENGWGLDSKFAVFDFGGGTLDFSFGVYREADEDIEEEEDYDYMIDVFNTAGDEKGGAEYLIHKISYQLYEANKDIMKKERIPFVIPEGENEIDLFPKELQSARTKPAIYNLKRLNEVISRDIFKGTYDKKESEYIELQDESGAMKRVDLIVDKDYLTAKLFNYIENKVKIFDELILKNLSELGNPYENLHIFRAGNASRSKLLENALEKNFKEKLSGKGSYIHFIDEPGVDEIKPKTAVVLGELNLMSIQDVGVTFRNKLNDEKTPFEFSIGVSSLENDQEFEEVISIGSIDQNWQRLGRVDRSTGQITIFYTNSVGLKEINNKNVKSNILIVDKEDLENGNVMWIRPKDSNRIEYIIGKKKEPENGLEGKIYELGRY